jgi:hypothetical protein
MKLIILILASDNDLYLQCQNMWRSYMNTHSNIKSYFIKYKVGLHDDVILENDTIFINGNECLIPGCLVKTINSIDFLLKTQEFDFIFRTNMSSVVDLHKFYNLLNNYKNDYSGVIGCHNNIKFASGAGLLLSKQLCSNLITYKNLLNYNLLDDVSIGLLFQSNNVSISPLTRFEVYNYENNINQITKEMIENYYHFRCKSDKDEKKTVLMMKKIVELIY